MPLPGWKCPKWFKLSLGEPWESEGSNDSDRDTDEVCYVRKLQRYIRIMQKRGQIFNDETKQQGTNWNNETLFNEIKSHNHYQ